MRNSSHVETTLLAAEAVASIPVSGRDVLTGILKTRAKRLPAQANHAEAEDWVSRHAERKDGRDASWR